MANSRSIILFLTLAIVPVVSNAICVIGKKTTCRFTKGVDIFPPQSLALEKKWVMKLTTSPYDKNISFTYKVHLDDVYHGLLTRYNISELAYLDTNIIRHNGLIMLYDLEQQAGETVKVLTFKTSEPRHFCYVVCGCENPDLTTTLRCYGGVGSTPAQMRKAIVDSGIDVGALKIEETKVQ